MIAQIKDAIRDGLRAVKNTVDDGAVVKGAGAFEVGASLHLLNNVGGWGRARELAMLDGRAAECVGARSLYPSGDDGIATKGEEEDCSWGPMGVCTGARFKTRVHCSPPAQVRKTVEGKAKLGVEAFAQALMGIPKILAENAGFDAQEVAIALQHEQDKGSVVGLDLATGEPGDVAMMGVYDNYCVKKQILMSAPVIASQLLLVDEVMRAGMNMRRGPPAGA